VTAIVATVRSGPELRPKVQANKYKGKTAKCSHRAKMCFKVSAGKNVFSGAVTGFKKKCFKIGRLGEIYTPREFGFLNTPREIRPFIIYSPTLACFNVTPLIKCPLLIYALVFV